MVSFDSHSNLKKRDLESVFWKTAHYFHLYSIYYLKLNYTVHWALNKIF